MNEKEWELFFKLLDTIVTMPGTWKEKRDEITEQAAGFDSEEKLDEFLGWFDMEE